MLVFNTGTIIFYINISGTTYYRNNEPGEASAESIAAPPLEGDAPVSSGSINPPLDVSSDEFEPFPPCVWSSSDPHRSSDNARLLQ